MTRGSELKGGCVANPHQRLAAECSIARARSVFSGICDEDVLGPDEVCRAVGMTVAVIPTVPFSDRVLETAANLGMSLVFEPRVPALSMKDVVGLGVPNVLYNTTSYENEGFFAKERLPGGWWLMGRLMVPGSNNKKYHDQTPVIVEAVRDFFGAHLSEEMKQAVKELGQCSGARANEMLRPLAVQSLWHMVLCQIILKRRIMSTDAVWTRSRASGGGIIAIGLQAERGAFVGDLDSSKSFENTGVHLALGPQVFRSK